MGRPDFAAISRRVAERDREALALIEAHDRGEAPQVTRLRHAG